jgi:hypothetical protein
MPQFNAAEFNQALFGGAPPAGAQCVPVGTGILYPALRKAGVTIGPGRTPSPAQFQDAFDELNRLTGSLNCDRLFIYTIDSALYPLDPPKPTYTIGLSDDPTVLVDFNVPRPQLIESANLVTGQSGSGALRYPLAIVTDLQWAKIRYQTLPNTIPTILYNDRAAPVSTLYLWGQPAPGQSLELFTWHQVPLVQSLTDMACVPMQYIDALVLNLACRIAPQFQRPLDPLVLAQARESLMRLESINAPQPILDVSGLCQGRGSSYNIYSDDRSGSTLGANK